MPKALSQEIRNKIVELYKSGLLLKEISEIVQHPYPTLTYILKKEVGYNNKRPSQGNIRYFENIDTHSKAYILGYIAADGCISINKLTKLSNLALACNSKDRCILEFIKNEINCETKILDSKPFDKRTNLFYNRSSLTLGNQILCKDLFNLGIYPNKTYTLTNIIQNIPKEYRKSMILGYFDGDGHISRAVDKRISNPEYRTYHISICGTESFLNGIVQELNIMKYTIVKKLNYCILKIHNKKDFYTFYSCYENLEFYLKRKHDVFLQRISYERTISPSL